MAEVRKNKKVEKYNVDDMIKDTVKKEKAKEKVKEKEVKNNNKSKKGQKTEKKSLWVKFRIFCHGVKSEFKRVHWTSKDDMIKYSISTIVFIIFCSIFFYVIDIIFALIQSFFN